MASAGTASVDIELNFDNVESALDAELSSLTSTVEVTAEADVSPVDAELAGLEATPVEVPVDADTSGVDSELASLDATPIDVQVEADTTDAQAAVESLGGSVDATGGSMSQLAGDAGGGAGALDSFAGAALGAGGASSMMASGGLATLVAGLGYSVNEAGEAQAAVAQLDQILENTGGNANVTSGHIQDLAASIMEYSGFSDEAVISGASTVLMFQNVRNEAGQPIFDRVIEASADLARKMGSDVPSAARTLGRALDDPAAGMGRLRRAGIQLTEAQQNEIIALQESGDMLGAQAALLDIVEGKVGGLARTYGDTLPGEVDKAKQSLGELAETMGTQMLPGITTFISTVDDAAVSIQDLDAGSASSLASFKVNMENALLALTPFGQVGFGLSQLGGELDVGLTDILLSADKLGAAFDGEAIPKDGLDNVATAADTAAAATQALVDSAVANLPTLGEAISNVDRAGQAFGILTASTDPTLVIANLQTLIDSFVNFSTNLATLPPIVQQALAPLGPAVAGPFAAALATAPQTTRDSLVGVLREARNAGVDLTSVLTGAGGAAVRGAGGAIAAGAPFVGATARGAGSTGAREFGSAIGSALPASAGTATRNAGAQIQANAPTGAAYQAGLSSGQRFGAGLSAGIGSSLGAATGQAIRVIQAAQAAASAQAGESATAPRLQSVDVAAAGVVTAAQQITAAAAGGSAPAHRMQNITVNIPNYLGQKDEMVRMIGDELRTLERSLR